jgi:hypothetical protein
VDLFQFDKNFIAAASAGASDEETLELFAEAIRAGADVLEQSLQRTAGVAVAQQVRFVNGAFEIPLDQEQYDEEFGDVEEPPKANVRRAIISSSIQASREMSRVLSGD